MKKTERRKSAIRWMAVAAFNIVILFLLVEAFSLFYIYSTEQRLHYRQPPDQNLLEQVKAKELTFFRFHPYFGVIKKPGYEIHTFLTANNCGFASHHDFPYVRASGSEFIVGIFGGSVAEIFANVAQDHFRAQLKQIEEFRDRDIIILNFSRGAYKQPQQLLLLTYFLSLGQHFDLVLNLDGFNEVVLALGNAEAGIDISMPSTDHILPLISLMDNRTLTAKSVELLYRLTRCREKIARGTDAMNSSVFAFGYVARRVFDGRNRAQYSILLNEYSDELAAGRSESLVCLYADLPDTDPGNDDTGDAINLWKTASLEMHLISEAHGFRYVHFLQPNQYYSKKTFTASEMERAISAGSDRQSYVAAGYPGLLEEAGNLRSSGVAVYSLVDAFDDVSDTVYTDDCCHFNRKGNYIISEKMADAIGQEVK